MCNFEGATPPQDHDAPQIHSRMGRGYPFPILFPLDAFGASFFPNLFFVPARLFVHSHAAAPVYKNVDLAVGGGSVAAHRPDQGLDLYC